MLTKDIQDLYRENYKTSLRDIKENVNKWREIMFTDRKVI